MTIVYWLPIPQVSIKVMLVGLKWKNWLSPDRPMKSASITRRRCERVLLHDFRRRYRGSGRTSPSTAALGVFVGWAGFVGWFYMQVAFIGGNDNRLLRSHVSRQRQRFAAGWHCWVVGYVFSIN